jgi:thiamine transport system substrate-binding protein
MNRTYELFLKAILSVLFAAVFFVVSHTAKASELVVYAYDSLLQKDGLGPLLKTAYEKKAGRKLRFVSVGDAGQLLTRVQLDAERKKGKAHAVLGIDLYLESKMKDFLLPLDRSREGAFMKFVDREWWSSEAFVPYDYGVLAFIADTKRLDADDFPRKWEDLLKRRFKRSLLLQDPRTSSPGLAFLLASEVVTRKSDDEKSAAAFDSFWKKLRPQWFALVPGWSDAYAMFLKGDAPLVWSYVSSEAYHSSRSASGESQRYKAVLFEEGHPVQVEGAAILKNAPGGEKMRKRALEFMELLTSEEIQSKIPETQWMMPVRLGVKLPLSFQSLPKARKRFHLVEGIERSGELVERWNRAIRD